MHQGPQFIGMPIGRIESGTEEGFPVERRMLHNNRPRFYTQEDKQHIVRIKPLASAPRDPQQLNSHLIATMQWEPKDSKLSTSQAEHVKEWPTEVGEVNDVWTREDHRRKGLATFMYGYAKRMSESDPTISAPVHSTHRSDEGDDWVKSTGDPVPKRKYKEY